MKSIVSVFFVIAATAGQGIAGNLTTPPIVPQIIEAPVAQNNWSGFYIGGMFGVDGGEWELLNSTTTPPAGVWDSEGTSYGAFAGYNLQFNNLVFGGELAYAVGDVDVSISSFTDTTLDAKARVGYALNNILLYGVAGWSTVDHDFIGTASVPTISLSGINYGAGAQYRFENGLFVGLEYLARDMTGPHATAATASYEYRKNTIALRIGKQF